MSRLRPIKKRTLIAKLNRSEYDQLTLYNVHRIFRIKSHPQIFQTPTDILQTVAISGFVLFILALMAPPIAALSHWSRATINSSSTELIIAWGMVIFLSAGVLIILNFNTLFHSREYDRDRATIMLLGHYLALGLIILMFKVLYHGSNNAIDRTTISLLSWIAIGFFGIITLGALLNLKQSYHALTKATNPNLSPLTWSTEQLFLRDSILPLVLHQRLKVNYVASQYSERVHDQLLNLYDLLMALVCVPLPLPDANDDDSFNQRCQTNFITALADPDYDTSHRSELSYLVSACIKVFPDDRLTLPGLYDLTDRLNNGQLTWLTAQLAWQNNTDRQFINVCLDIELLDQLSELLHLLLHPMIAIKTDSLTNAFMIDSFYDQADLVLNRSKVINALADLNVALTDKTSAQNFVDPVLESVCQTKANIVTVLAETRHELETIQANYIQQQRDYADVINQTEKIKNEQAMVRAFNFKPGQPNKK